MAHLISTADLVGKRVVGGKKDTQRIGKVRCCIFHPTENRCVGLLVKRPDVALMFHRKDFFVALDGYTLQDGHLQVSSEDDSTGRAAMKRLGIDPEMCVIWSGLPVMTIAGQKFGHVGAIIFDAESGQVESIVVSDGAANNALLGTLRVPAHMIRGFTTGMGESLLGFGEADDDETDPNMLGALIVSKEVAQLQTQGGAAEQAGHATAVAINKAQEAAAAAKPKVDDAAKAAGDAAKDAVKKGAFTTGRAIGKTRGMFAAFKEEYDKALNDGQEHK